VGQRTIIVERLCRDGESRRRNLLPRTRRTNSRVSEGNVCLPGYKKAWMTQVPTTLVAGNLLFELSSHIDVPSKIYTLPPAAERVFPATIEERGASPTVAREGLASTIPITAHRLFFHER